MKMWQKITSFALCFGFTFFAGCDKINSLFSSEESVEDVTTESVVDSGEDSVVDSTETDASLPLSAWLTDAKTATVDFSLKMDTPYTITTLCECGNGNKYETGVDSMMVEGSWTMSVTDNGLDMLLSLQATNEDETVQETIYLIDGVLYLQNQNEETPSFIVAPKTLWAILEEEMGIDEATVIEILDEVKVALEEIPVTPEQIDGAIANLFSGAKIEDEVLMLTFDAKDAIMSELAYLKSLQATDTVGSLVNHALAIFSTAEGEPLTYEAILTAVEGAGDLSLNEIAEAIDKFLTDEYQTTLQGVFDELMAQEDVILILTEMGLAEEDIAEIKAFKFADFLTENGEITIDDILAMLLAEDESAEASYSEESASEEAASEEVIDTVAEIVAVVREAMNTTLEDAGIYEVLAEIPNIEIGALYDKIGIQYNEDMECQKIVMKTGISISVDFIYDDWCDENDCMQEKVVKETMSVALEVELSEVSATPKTIALPEGATVTYKCANCGKTEGIELHETGVFVCEACKIAIDCDYCDLCDTFTYVDYDEHTDLIVCADCKAEYANKNYCDYCGKWVEGEVTHDEVYDWYLCGDCYTEVGEKHECYFCETWVEDACWNEEIYDYICAECAQKPISECENCGLTVDEVTTDSHTEMNLCASCAEYYADKECCLGCGDWYYLNEDGLCLWCEENVE